nr:immunoglobulin light chain junction region [Macaca mulatta]
WQQYNSNPLTF